MYDHWLMILMPLLVGAGLLSGWLGTRNEYRVAKKNDFLIRRRALVFGMSFYAIAATLALCCGGLYADKYWQYALQSKQATWLLMPMSLQNLIIGAMATLASVSYFLRSFAEKHGMDII